MAHFSTNFEDEKEIPKMVKLDNTVPNDIKEKQYITRQVESSIAILESPEDDVVLEALLYLSRYVDLQINNLSYPQQCNLLQKLLNLLDRNVCIQRLTLRLLGLLLSIEDVMVEIDQEMYDDKVVKISNMYITNTDPFVKQFCALALSKLADSCRVTCLIFKVDLLNPLLDTIYNTKDMILLESTLELFLKLLSAPAALGILPDLYNFDISVLLTHLENENKQIASLSFEIIDKLTFYCVEIYQMLFKQVKLIELMLSVVMDPDQEEFHEIALNIIINSMNSEETSNYFIESLEFLKFCQWVKTCDQKYLFPCICILEQLTRIPSRKQILFDLSVEDSILYCLRSTEKPILNKTCQAISNMTTHKYCCERMLTQVVIRELFNMMFRTDEVDPGNEVALKTILDFSRRNLRTLDLIYDYGFFNVLLDYLKKALGLISEENFLGVLEMLYKLSIHPAYQQAIISTNFFFERLLNLFQTASDNIAAFSCEILTNFVSSANFRRIFLTSNGPQIFVGVLQTSDNTNLLGNVLMFIHSNLIYENMAKIFLQNNLVRVLKGFPENVRSKAPIMNRILALVYNINFPLKFFETNRLEITDKLENKFYLINGPWKAPFPFLEILEATQVSTIYTIYVVDLTYEVIKIPTESSIQSDITICVSIMSDKISSENMAYRRSPFQLNYGKLSPDPFFPRYVYHISKYIEPASRLKEKIQILADYVNSVLCGANEDSTMMEKIMSFKQHIKALKTKLGTSMIPIGFLRMGFHCERALLFKALADKFCIPTSLVKGMSKLYWNEIAIFDGQRKDDTLKMYVVDLMNNIGNLLEVGSKAAFRYCNLIKA